MYNHSYSYYKNKIKACHKSFNKIPKWLYKPGLSALVLWSFIEMDRLKVI